MISTAPSVVWIERSYGLWDQICSKKKNMTNFDNLRELLFLAILKLSPKDFVDYIYEVKNF